MAEKTAVLTLLRFPASAGCLRGVLEATQEDVRAGVFTADLSFSLTRGASENLQTKATMSSMVNMPVMPSRKTTHRTLSLRVERTEGLNAAFFSPAGLFRGALAAGSAVCLRFSSAALLLGTGLSREAGLAFCRQKPPIHHLNSIPEAGDDPQKEQWEVLD